MCSVCFLQFIWTWNSVWLSFKFVCYFMAHEHLRKDVFTPFAVGDVSRSKGGSGLGLSISQKIIQAHGWSIRLAEERMHSGGTVFEILLPLPIS